MSKTIRWIIVPFAATFGLLLSIGLAIPLNHLIHTILWSQGRVMPGKEFLSYALRLDGALAAALFITLGYAAAPSHRILVAVILFLVGTVLAWLLVGDFGSSIRTPEPQHVWWPLLGTLAGGVVTLAILFLHSWHRKNI